MRDIARFHSIYLDDVAHLLSEPWMCVYSGNVMKALSGFWRALLRQNQVSFSDLWTTARYFGIHAGAHCLHFAHLHTTLRTEGKMLDITDFKLLKS